MTTRKQIARDLVVEVREADARLAKLSGQTALTLAEHGSRLLDGDGTGQVVATPLLGRTGRFPSSSAFASYAGVAPVDVARSPARVGPVGPAGTATEDASGASAVSDWVGGLASRPD